MIVRTLAEATLAAGQATDRHHHRLAEEISLTSEGSGPAAAPCLKLLCCCAPASTHDDTYFE